MELTYQLRYVPLFLNHGDIHNNLSYYDTITNIQEVNNLPSTQREILITFDHYAKLSLLDHIWSVNIKGHNISIAKAHLSISQLDYRQHYVVGFKGFNHKTTESQALRLLRPYGSMSCHFHNNLAYIAFKSADQMHAVCRLRLYTDDDRLLSGRPRFSSKQEQLQPPETNLPNITQTCKAMSTHTSNLPDIHSYDHPSNRSQYPRRGRSPRRDNRSAYKPRLSGSPLAINSQADDNLHTSIEVDMSIQPANLEQPTLTNRSVSKAGDQVASLDLILSKLSELDAIKTHLNTIDLRLNQLQPQSNIKGSVAQRS